MKKIFLLFLFNLPLIFYTQYVLKNEQIIYSFKTTNDKLMFLVKDKENKYIQYRFGTNNKIELEFPTKRNKESWKKFQYNYYLRGGGKENSGMEIGNLQFTKNGFNYLIFSTYFSENEKISAGIIITDSKKKEMRILGNTKTIAGCICNLEDSELIEKTDIELSF